jgi:hypothetical protein
MSKHTGTECPSSGKLMSRAFVSEFCRNAPSLRHWICEEYRVEWTSEAPSEVATEREPRID